MEVWGFLGCHLWKFRVFLLGCHIVEVWGFLLDCIYGRLGFFFGLPVLWTNRFQIFIFKMPHMYMVQTRENRVQEYHFSCLNCKSNMTIE